jgi:hypothetical protein
MDDTYDKHAYRCFPVSLANQAGWFFSFSEDIEFIWDGITDTNSNHITILKGEKFLSTNRANATLSFDTGLTIETKKNLSLLIMPVPNQFIDGISCYTTIISTSVLKAPLPAAWRITKSNEVIKIPSGTPIAAILPISIKDIETHQVNLLNYFNPELDAFLSEYGSASAEISKNNKWTDFYRNAVDHKGNKIGEHQVKKIDLYIKNV